MGEWIDYGKTYGQLVHDLKQVGESIVGIQVDLIDPRFPNEPGLFLIGDLNREGDVSGEEYMMITSWTVTRYRRVLTAEELEE